MRRGNGHYKVLDGAGQWCLGGVFSLAVLGAAQVEFVCLIGCIGNTRVWQHAHPKKASKVGGCGEGPGAADSTLSKLVPWCLCNAEFVCKCIRLMCERCVVRGSYLFVWLEGCPGNSASNDAIDVLSAVIFITLLILDSILSLRFGFVLR